MSVAWPMDPIAAAHSLPGMQAKIAPLHGCADSMMHGLEQEALNVGQLMCIAAGTLVEG